MVRTIEKEKVSQGRMRTKVVKKVSRATVVRKARAIPAKRAKVIAERKGKAMTVRRVPA